jgi:flagellar biosynthesis/type III secretory pathway chaperone
VTDSQPLMTQAAKAQELAMQLAQMLELEFQALRKQELEHFEQLQPVKSELLSDITRLAPPASELQNDPEWQDFRASMVTCRDLHRRNEVLIERKLEAIRGTLQSLRVQDATSPIEVYDRLGHIARFSRVQGYNDA